MLAFEVERHFARDGKQPQGDVAGKEDIFLQRHRAACDDVAGEHVEDGVGVQHRVNSFGCDQQEWLPLAQAEQPGD